MVEEIRAMKYCELCSKNHGDQALRDNYMHQAMIACEDAIKGREKQMETYKKNWGLSQSIYSHIKDMKKALETCASCDGTAKMKCSLESIANSGEMLDFIISSEK